VYPCADDLEPYEARRRGRWRAVALILPEDDWVAYYAIVRGSDYGGRAVRECATRADAEAAIAELPRDWGGWVIERRWARTEEEVCRVRHL
jgi:NADH:ubiquinone oxidoreductase subunit